ncbi:fructosamine kinase family protein [Palleronia sp. LCG004]|uniref:fructosamine kinase family protein n=1 Tax=Palleronia sp. LCG004 TaxID=3079304 RepID=UPI002942AE2E|nr:fructosamine kinase family protein [Palleronia sp. LCG004]WOI55152.1 fructosamine kinase family protein [Palleronia sp. LCG004]
MLDLGARVAALTGLGVFSVSPLSGGDIAQVARITLEDGRCVIAKSGGPSMTEARMLRAIAATGCAAPEVLEVAEDILIMSDLAEGSGSDEAWAKAGAAVAQLHANEGESYGWDEPTAFGNAPCPADRSDDWPTFWAQNRLLAWPGSLPSEIAQRVEALAPRVDDLLPETPRASLLHGDLWRGNLLLDGRYFSGLIDPACYYGDAEVDLAALTLFASPPPSFWEAYGKLDRGWEKRRALYQLWPALVHLRLFGAGYREMVETRLTALGA